MRKPISRLLLLSLSAASIACPAWADPPLLYLSPYNLEIPQDMPVPADEAFYETELWIFQRPQTWNRLVSRYAARGWAPSLLKEQVRYKDLPEDEKLRLQRLMPKSDLPHLHYVRVTPQLRSRLPDALIGTVYDIQRVQDGTRLRPLKKFRSLESAKAGFIQRGMSPEDADRLLRRAVPGKERWYLPLTPETRALMPEDLANQIAASYRNQANARIKALRATIPVDESTIPEIVKFYAKPGTEKALEEKLRTYLPKAQGYPYFVPVTEIASPFIRENLGRFEPLADANCHNSGLCVAFEKLDDKRFSGGRELYQRLSREWAPIEPGTPLKHEDILVYWKKFANTSLRAEHTATYFGEGQIQGHGDPVSVVFSKNGFTSQRPYLLTTLESVDRTYGDSHFVSVYRKLPEPLQTPPTPHEFAVPYRQLPSRGCAQKFTSLTNAATP